MSFNEYLTASKDSAKQRSFEKWLKNSVKNTLKSEYSEFIRDDSEKDICKILAKEEVKKMSFERRLAKYLSIHFESLDIKGKSFYQQINDMKRSKYDNQINKMTSIEPNTILNFLILGYYDYIARNQGTQIYSINQIVDAINENKVNYLHFGENFVKSLKNSNMHVKNISNPIAVCRKLRYLLPPTLNSRLKEYFVNLCNETCENLSISG